jgi:2-polyprenyl-3-methyl-5-hydroxy-6-metoxy-1,4-benzoquinol methylase
VADFDARSYWEGRLGQDWSLTGVGFRRMGKRFNEWAYRRRGERFEAVVREFLPDLSASRVLDVGSGTGFFLDAWKRLGAKEVVALDLTDVAVTNLRKVFPHLDIHHGDISTGLGDLQPASFDVISAMDVLFHVVDNSRFAIAIQNIAELLSPGGVFIWSDLFVHGREDVQEHFASRSLYRSEAVMDAAGFDILGRRPMFHLMNEPRDMRSRVLFEAWRGVMFVASQAESLGNAAGRLGYHLDAWLDQRGNESISSEFMICRKR